MKEFIEKLIGRLEEYKDSHLIEHDSEEYLHCTENEDDWCNCRNCFICVWDKAKAIVKELAEEYINTSTDTSINSSTWIPCSERLPNCEKDFLVTLRDGDIKVARYEKEENIWVDIIEGYFEYPVAAWCELPEPYKKGSETDE